MTLGDFLDEINELLPPKTAMQGDRIGLQVQSSNIDFSKALVALEVTETVIAEAISKNCKLIVTFHPLIWQALSSINSDERVGNLVTKLIQNSISLFSIHTTFDSYTEGTSKIISNLLGLEFIDFLVPSPINENCGMGVLARFASPVHPETFLEILTNSFGGPLRFARGSAKEIKTVAIVGGSGTSFFDDALDQKADAFITADVTYHQFHKADGKLWLIDAGHYEMEQFVPEHLAKLLNKHFQGKALFDKSETITNPVYYYPKNEKIEIKKFNNKK
jgi:dinuclear metal center YbgI/SA1388 family protein